MGKDSGSIELKSEEVLDLKLGAAPSVAAAGTAPFAQSGGPGIEIGVDAGADLELSLSPERIVPSSLSAGGAVESTSVVDLGEDLLDRTAVISRSSLSSPPNELAAPDRPGSTADSDAFEMSLDAVTEESLPVNGGAVGLLAPNAYQSTNGADSGSAVAFSGELLPHDPLEGSESISAIRTSGEQVASQKPDVESSILSRFEHELIEPDFPSESENDREITALWDALVREFGSDAEWDGFLDSGAPRSQGDRVDLGISYLEMGIYHAALREFEAVRREDPCNSSAIVPLQAQALLRLGRPFDALAVLESVLGDPDLNTTPEGFLKSELQYWAARCCEVLGRTVDASLWFQLVAESDPDYRDTLSRLRVLSGEGR